VGARENNPVGWKGGDVVEWGKCGMARIVERFWTEKGMMDDVRR